MDSFGLRLNKSGEKASLAIQNEIENVPIPVFVFFLWGS
jgi:hypothetical protein